MNLESFVYYAFALIISITVHEAAHAWMAYKLGDYTAKYEGRVTLNPLAHLDPIGTLMIFVAHFGWGKPVPYNPYHLKNPKTGGALIALAGPVANFLTALILSLPLQYFNFAILGAVGNFLGEVLITTVLLNVALMVFNILPIAPLDGSKILHIFIPTKYEQKYAEYLRMGPFVLIGLILLQSFGIDFLGKIMLPIVEAVFAVIQLIT